MDRGEAHCSIEHSRSIERARQRLEEEARTKRNERASRKLQRQQERFIDLIAEELGKSRKSEPGIREVEADWFQVTLPSHTKEDPWVPDPDEVARLQEFRKAADQCRARNLASIKP